MLDTTIKWYFIIQESYYVGEGIFKLNTRFLFFYLPKSYHPNLFQTRKALPISDNSKWTAHRFSWCSDMGQDARNISLGPKQFQRWERLFWVPGHILPSLGAGDHILFSKCVCSFISFLTRVFSKCRAQDKTFFGPHLRLSLTDWQ